MASSQFGGEGGGGVAGSRFLKECPWAIDFLPVFKREYIYFLLFIPPRHRYLNLIPTKETSRFAYITRISYGLLK